MNTTNPYRNSAERRPLSERDMLEAARVRIVRGANNMRLALYNHDPTVAVPQEQLGQLLQFDRQFQEPQPQTTPADVPEALNNVVDMMDRADQRQQTEREIRVNDALRLANEIHDEIAA